MTTPWSLVVRLSAAVSLSALVACGAGSAGTSIGPEGDGVLVLDGGRSDGGSEAGSGDASASDGGMTKKDAAREGDRCHATSDCAPSAMSWELSCVAASDCYSGAPIQSECQNDADCADAGASNGPKVCATVGCGGRTCRAACVGDATCAASEQCDPGGHCVPRTCTADASCPKTYACTSGKCARKRCTRDDECPQGACVNGGCEESLGQCLGPAA